MHPPPPSVFDCGQGCDRVSSARRCMSVRPSVLLPPPAPVLPTTCHISDLIYHHQLSSSLHRYHRLCCANHQHRQQQAGRSAGRQGSQVTTHSGAQVHHHKCLGFIGELLYKGDVPIHPHPLLSLTDPACSFHGKRALTDRTAVHAGQQPSIIG